MEAAYSTSRLEKQMAGGNHAAFQIWGVCFQIEILGPSGELEGSSFANNFLFH